jgi:hypothetical protein
MWPCGPPCSHGRQETADLPVTVSREQLYSEIRENIHR